MPVGFPLGAHVPVPGIARNTAEVPQLRDTEVGLPRRELGPGSQAAWNPYPSHLAKWGDGGGRGSEPTHDRAVMVRGVQPFVVPAMGPEPRTPQPRHAMYQAPERAPRRVPSLPSPASCHTHPLPIPRPWLPGCPPTQGLGDLTPQLWLPVESP